MTDRAAAELKDDILAEKINQLVHLARMNAAGATGISLFRDAQG